MLSVTVCQPDGYCFQSCLISSKFQETKFKVQSFIFMFGRLIGSLEVQFLSFGRIEEK